MKKALIVLGLLLGLSMALAAPNGQQLYQTYCMSCHQANGKGLPGAFPPLAGEVPEIIAKGPKGRVFPIDVVLFGLQGKITAGGGVINSVMPGFASQLKDDQVAAILNYVAKAWGNDKKLPKGFKDYQAAEVAKERAKKLTPQKVYEIWKMLESGDND